ncbi:MAG: rutE [Francisellaceae bacterium]|nr:rutE [Francisellaceae bacterium]
MQAIPNEALKQLFTEARTYTEWLPKPIADDILLNIYNLVKWGPTSLNLCPARIVFIKTHHQKEKLLGCLSPTNIEKVKAAPVTAIIAYDENFIENIEKLYPHGVSNRAFFESDPSLAQATAFRNSSLQGAYLIMAARALGLDCGPMSGFDNKKLDETFFKGLPWKSNFICNIGYGDKLKLRPRLARLDFDEACQIL